MTSAPRRAFTVSGSGRKAPFIAYGRKGFACVIHPKPCTECEGGKVVTCHSHSGNCDCAGTTEDCSYCGGNVEIEEFECQCLWCAALVEQVENEGRMVVSDRGAAGIR
jgi:hypothetical protein